MRMKVVGTSKEKKRPTHHGYSAIREGVRYPADRTAGKKKKDRPPVLQYLGVDQPPPPAVKPLCPISLHPGHTPPAALHARRSTDCLVRAAVFLLRRISLQVRPYPEAHARWAGVTLQRRRPRSWYRIRRPRPGLWVS